MSKARFFFLYFAEWANNGIITVRCRGVAQSGLARLHGVQEVGGSNPLAPTFLFVIARSRRDHGDLSPSLRELTPLPATWFPQPDLSKAFHRFAESFDKYPL